MWKPLVAGLLAQVPLRGAREFALRIEPDVFTPKDLIELSRPSVGTPNADGSLVFNTVAQYSSDSRKNDKTLVITSVASKAQARYPLPDGGELFWLDAQTLGHVVPVEEETSSSLFAISLKVEAEAAAAVTPAPPTLIGTFPSATAANFVYSALGQTLVFTDKVYADGNLSAIASGDAAWAARGNSAFVYDDGFERHWDSYTGPKKYSLFAVALAPDGAAVGGWRMGHVFLNLLKDAGHGSPVEPFGIMNAFAVSADYVAYSAKDPVLPEAWHTRENIYIVPLQGGTPHELTSGKQGSARSLVFDSTGSKLAWLEREKDRHESDRARIVLYDLEKNVRFTLTEPWDRSPDGLAFAPDAPLLYLTAGDHATTKLFLLPLSPTPEQNSTKPTLDPHFTIPRALTALGGSTSAPHARAGGRVLFSRSTLGSPMDVFVLSAPDLPALLANETSDPRTHINDEGAHIVPSHLAKAVTIERITAFADAELADKSLAAPEHMYFDGHDGRRIHGYALRPRGWTSEARDAGKKWPVVMLVHGGPESVYGESWSSFWNPNVFAQRGYFVLAFNPAGSTTFGQELTDSIQEHWGSRPFVDLQAGWKHALALYPEIDPARAVAGGASWGGYAMNWIQGHQAELGFDFKALLCHAGVFDAAYVGFSTDEPFFFEQEWGGVPWEPRARANLKKYNPREFVDRWRTPMLIVHGSKDYRLPETEGIAAYHALRQQDVPARLVIFPDEPHGVTKHGNILKWYEEVFRWFDLYVGEKDGAKDV